MKSRKKNRVLGKKKRAVLVFKLLVLAIMLQCTMGLHTCHLPNEGDDFDVISTFKGLSAIQCSLKCTTSPEKCDAIASEATGGKIGSCQLLKFASATAISLAPPNRLDKGKKKGKITVLKPKKAPVAAAWGEWSTWTDSSSCDVPCKNVMMKERTRACDSPAPLNSGPFCAGASNESIPCGTLDCVHGDEALEYCQSQSLSLAGSPFIGADLEALADTLPLPNVLYWCKLTDQDPVSGYTYTIKSMPSRPRPFTSFNSPNYYILPAACE